MKPQHDIEDFATAPNETLQDCLDAKGMTVEELAQRSQLSGDTVRQILDGQQLIEEDTADALAKALKVPDHFWLNMQRSYFDYLR